jgi:septal ring factor EnvC (AmiA/AmiB activator)
MAYTLTEAARAVQKDKTTLLRAIKSGKVSAVRDAVTGGWRIDPAELHRVYPVTATAAADAVRRDADAEVEIRELRARLADKDDIIADLRRRLDAKAQDRRQAQAHLAETQAKLTALLTDQRQRPPPAAPAAPPVPRRSWWPWRRG